MPTVLKVLTLTTILAMLGFGFAMTAIAGVATGRRVWSLAEAAALVLLAGSLVVVGVIVIRAVWRNPIGWLLLFAGFTLTVVGFSGQLGFAVSGTAETLGDIPPNLVGVVEFLASTSLVALGLTLGILLSAVLLFPTGRLPSPGWRAVLWMVIMNAALWSASIIGPAASGDLIKSDGRLSLPAAWNLVALSTLVAAGLIVISLIVRYRAAEQIEQHQVKWLMYSVSVFVVYTIVDTRIFDPADPVRPALANLVAFAIVAFIPLSIGIAVMRYRLYDIDIVISRTLVFALLAAFITAVYAVVVAGIGNLVGGSSLGWSILATAVVAVAFEPIRNRAQRWANRLVYGDKATPYEVLSDLTARLGQTEAEEGLVDRMARRLALGTGAERAVVWMKRDGSLHPAAVSPFADVAPPSVATADQLPGFSARIIADDETLGALTVEKRRGQSFSPAERTLVSDLAGSAGLVLRKLRLDAALTGKAGELQSSRRRLVSAADDGRRRLERDLRRVIEPKVEGMQETIATALATAQREGLDQSSVVLDGLGHDLASSRMTIRALARGIYPEVLEDGGLGPALADQLSRAPIPATLEADGLGRYSSDIETAVYFSVLEAMQNLVKYADATSAEVRLSEQNGDLQFEVSDDGIGFDITTVQRGAGLTNMTDRIETAGGALTVDSMPDRGTTIAGVVPVVKAASGEATV